MPQPETAAPPTPFGQYQIIEKIAQGGMAEIFRGKALDTHGIEKPVVIKRILPHIAASPEFVEMLIDEAKIAVMLSHGNIAQIYDLGKIADDYFIVMEYVEGKTLSQLMRRLRAQGRQIPIPYAVAICLEIARGLDYMHRKTDDAGNPLHIIHRDISPQNIILSTAGTVKIIDFGIAKAKTKVSTTDSGVVKGKFAYMSPEHAEGEKLDSKTDIFSLGIILFEMLTGQRLFKGKDNAETLKKVKRVKVPSPSSLRDGIPRELDQTVLKALQKDRAKRHDSAHAFEQDLNRVLVIHYPQFNPNDLAQFLHEIFPEIRPEKGEEVPSLTIHPQDKGEVTVAADTGVMREKLKELDAFELPQEKEEPSLSPMPEELEEGTSQIRTGRFKFAATALSALLLIGVGVFLYLHKRPSRPAETIIPPPAPSAPEQVAEIPKPPAFGFLIIDSDPKGASVFLDDRDTGKKTPSALQEIPPQVEHRVGLYLDHYKFWEGRFRVEAGKSASLQIPLEPNLGDLVIESLPTGAAVYLNDRYVGLTPYNLLKIPPETTYRVQLKMAGYEDWEREVKIFGGKKEVVSASLNKRLKNK